MSFQYPEEITVQVNRMPIQGNGQNTIQANAQPTPQVKSREDMNFDILSYCVEPRSRREIAEMCGLRNLRYLSSQYLSPLLEKGFLQLTLPEKPRSSKQKYQTVIIKRENEKK